VAGGGSGKGSGGAWAWPARGSGGGEQQRRECCRGREPAARAARQAMLGSQAFSTDFPVIRGQPGGHYHVSLLTYGKTRGCNFIHVILLPSGGGHEPTGFLGGVEVRCG